MASSKLTIIGFEEYLKTLNKSLFDKMVLPPLIDRELFINNTLMNGADFEVLYASPFFMQDAISVWSKKYYSIFEKWSKALQLEFNPLHNYDRTEEWTDDGQNSTSSSTSSTSSTSATSNNTGADNSLNKVSAYNSDVMEDNNSTTSSTSSTAASSGSSTMDDNSSSASTSHNLRKGRTYGNIGVTTSMQMLSEYCEGTEKLDNLIQHMTDLFLRELTVMVYI